MSQGCVQGSISFSFIGESSDLGHILATNQKPKLAVRWFHLHYSLPCFGSCSDLGDYQNVSVLPFLKHSGGNEQTLVFSVCSFLFVYVFAGSLRAPGRAGPQNQTAWTVKFGKSDGREGGIGRVEKTPALKRQTLPSLKCGSLTSRASELAASF